MTESQVDKNQVAYEVAEIKQKNSQTLAKLSQLFEKAEQQKAVRDTENAAVKTIASQLESMRKKVTELQSKLSRLEKELAPIRKELGSAEQIKAEIQTLEYSLHVNYSPAREKAVSRQTKELSAKLKTLTSSAPKLQELTKLRTELREARRSFSDGVKQLKTRAAQSEVHHEEMLKIFKQADQLQSALPEAFTKLDEKRTTLNGMRKVENEQRKKETQEFDAQRKVQKQAHDKKMDEVKLRAKEILEKFKLGKSISFEELQVLQVAGIAI